MNREETITEEIEDFDCPPAVSIKLLRDIKEGESFMDTKPGVLQEESMQKIAFIKSCLS